MRAPSLLLFALTSACVADTGLLDPTLGPPAPPRDAGAPEPVEETSVFDPSARITPEPDVIVYDPELGLGVLQGSAFDLARPASGWLLAWIQNVNGRLTLVTARVTRDGASALSTIVRPEPGGAAPERVALATVGDRTFVAWSTDRTVELRRLDERGELTDERGTSWAHGGDVAPAIELLPRGDGLVLLVARGAAAEGEVTFVLELDRDGRRTMDGPPLIPIRGRTAVDDRGLLVVLSSLRAAADDDEVRVTTFRDEDREIVDARAIYTAENAIGRAIGPSGAPRFVTVTDLDLGAQLLTIDGRRRWPLTSPSYGATTFAHEPDGARVLILHEAGTYRTTNPLPIRLEAFAVDPDTDARSDPVVLYDAGDGGPCIEQSKVVADGRRAGVAWVTGCATRILRFVELRGR
ncbi:hypothetical protein L6R52_21070 [Myxococcota bacterium]|nr:hypothetical protein [Myxococcota bacterium]